MIVKLLMQACAKFILGIALVGALLFLPAGTLRFWNGWLFLALLFVPMLILGAVLFLRAPELLAKRLNTREKEPAQRALAGLSALLFAAGFLTAGLDFRLGWSQLPPWAVATASVIMLAAYSLYAEVMRENAYLSRTVEVQEDQKVIDKGLYGVVRHPMYAATILLFLSIPIVLGSGLSFLIFLLYPFVIVKRILNEETVLAQGLEGYRDYQRKVKFRLIPFFW